MQYARSFLAGFTAASVLVTAPPLSVGAAALRLPRDLTFPRGAVGTAGPGHFDLHTDSVSYPLSVSLVTVLDAGGTGTQVTTIDQRFIEGRADIGTSGAFASYEWNEVTPQDTLDILAFASITGNSNQSSAQKYVAFDTRGECYAQTITAAANTVTSISKPVCDHAAAMRALNALLAR